MDSPPDNVTGAPCYACGRPADSLEHIVPNGVGGKLTSRELLCREHNGELGSQLDAELCRQLLPLLNALGIAPKRSTPDVLVRVPSADGGPPVSYRRNAAGVMQLVVPRHTLTRDGSSATLTVEASSLRELRQVARGYKRKYPKLDVEELLCRVKQQTIPYYGPVQFSMDGRGGEAFFRAIAKIAVGFARYSGVARHHLADAVTYVLGKHDEPAASPYYADDIVDDPRRHGAHIVAVRSSSDEPLLSAYVEIFGVIRCAVVLCSNYDGPAVDSVYAYDIVNAEEFRPLVRPWQPPRSYEGWPVERVRAAFGQFLLFVRRKSLNEAIDAAVLEAFASVGAPGDMLTTEDLIPALMRSLDPLLCGLVASKARAVGATGRRRVWASLRDPCACGSGLQFRKCCARAAK